MFVPQAITAIGASLLGAGLSRRRGVRRIYLLGLVADLVSMALLVTSQFAGSHAPAYAICWRPRRPRHRLRADGARLEHPGGVLLPRAVDSAVLVLNALLGLGTALAPVFAAVFVGLGLWWGLPVLVGALIAALLAFSAALPLEARAAGGAAPRVAPAALLDLRGVRPPLRHGGDDQRELGHALHDATLGASAAVASLALTIFWATVTAGRVLFAADRALVPAARRVPLPAFRDRRRVRSRPRSCRGASPFSASSPSPWPASAARRSCRSPSASDRTR